MSNPAFNLLQLERHPNWYDHLGQAEAAMAEQDRIDAIRTAAGWTCDEGGWYSPCGMHESDWELEGRPFPEDPDYAAFWSAYIHYEFMDSCT